MREFDDCDGSGSNDALADRSATDAGRKRLAELIRGGRVRVRPRPGDPERVDILHPGQIIRGQANRPAFTSAPQSVAIFS